MSNKYCFQQTVADKQKIDVLNTVFPPIKSPYPTRFVDLLPYLIISDSKW